MLKFEGRVDAMTNRHECCNDYIDVCMDYLMGKPFLLSIRFLFSIRLNFSIGEIFSFSPVS